jgi:cyanophycin synthetase
MAIEDLPSSFGGAARHNVQNALFAAAIAHGMDVTLDDIRRGLSSFECTEAMNPGRANLCRTDPFKVVLDYAHNPAAYEAVGRMVRALDGDGRRLCVFTSPSNRDDAHLREVAKTVAGYFDVFVCRESLMGDGSPSGVPEKLRAALLECGVAAERITVIPDEEAAVTAGLKMARRGDVVFVQLSPRPGDRMWRLIESFPAA